MISQSQFDIRQLYRPIQPSVPQNGHDILYEEFLPDKSLLPYIYCYWQLQTTKVLDESFAYRVVSDGCIDILFQRDNPAENFVMGFYKQKTEVNLGTSFHYIGIRFFPTVFPALFRVSAKEISNRSERLEFVAAKTSRFLQQYCTPLDTVDAITTKLNRYFYSLLSNTDITVDGRLQNALHIILAKHGTINITDDLQTGLSTRQLRRYFEHFIGDTPKTFSKVVRFQNILQTHPTAQSMKEQKLFFDAGYYDQAHFIKEFKRFYGITPSKAFRA
jgi:AraC-like DNA-binding protein